MAVYIYKAGYNIEACNINELLRFLTGQITDGNDAVATYANISYKGPGAGSFPDSATMQQQAKRLSIRTGFGRQISH